MLRLPPYQFLEPTTVAEAVELLNEGPEPAMVLAGGTDLVPNMKHGLFEPSQVVSLGKIPGLSGIESKEGTLHIGPMTKLTEVSEDLALTEGTPALAQAASLVAGRQLRNVGTLGGNLMLDTRCRWYNQTYFWRKALGYCLKKDGTVCHVVEGGKRCVAAASNDTAPALMTLNATAVFLGPQGERRVAVADLWKNDGIMNKAIEPGELLISIQIPVQASGHRGSYVKLRTRNSIDFPLLGFAVRLDVDSGGIVEDADLAAVALAARPMRVKGVADILRGQELDSHGWQDAVQQVCDLAYKRCRPLDNVPGDAQWRREMVPVYVRKALDAAACSDG